MAAKKTGDDRSLRRLGGGRWQTRDERFTIEPQSGTWVLVDAEQTDDLGLPLVRGPFRSLTDAKAAVEEARGTAAPESPLAGRVKVAGSRPATTPAVRGQKHDPTKAAARPARPSPIEPEPPAEPRWIADLGPRDRGRARRLIERLELGGIPDAEGVVRRDLTGGVPTVARIAISARLAGVLPRADDEARAIDRAIGSLVEVLDHGRDDDLDVRWRLVDGDDRPIGMTADDVRTAMKRRAESVRRESDR